MVEALILAAIVRGVVLLARRWKVSAGSGASSGSSDWGAIPDGAPNPEHHSSHHHDGGSHHGGFDSGGSGGLDGGGSHGGGGHHH